MPFSTRWLRIERASRLLYPLRPSVLLILLPAYLCGAALVIEAMGDGTGSIMLDGKMQDDATVKQCRVMLSYAEMIARRDSDYAEMYGFDQV